MNAKESVINYLNEKDITYALLDHAPIFTIEQLNEMEDYEDKEKVAKNLFLRNDSGNRHYLVVVRGNKTVDLKDLRKQIGSSRLGFASEERLMKHLKITKGSVSPLAIINDTTRKIPVLIDRDLAGEEKIGVHPNINTSTLWMDHDSLVKAIEAHGNEVIHVDVPSL